MSRHLHMPREGAVSRAPDTRASLQRVVRSIVFLSTSLPWIAACSNDGGAPTSSQVQAPRIASASPARSHQSLAAVLREIDRSAARAPAGHVVRSTIVAGGRAHELTGIAAIRAALEKSRPVTASPSSGDGHQSFAIPANDDDSLKIVHPMSILLTEPSRFRFLSYTSINKTGTARFTFSGSRSVHAIVGSTASLVWTDQGTRTVQEADGDAFVEWPNFQLSSGCRFSATMNTRHESLWPWGFVIPGFVPVAAAPQATGASGDLRRDCSGAPAPPPAPSPPESGCLDPSLAGCEGGSGGSGRSGASQAREVGRSGGSKTVCWVTDWYQDGVYLETTYNYCWTELIY